MPEDQGNLVGVEVGLTEGRAALTLRSRFLSAWDSVFGNRALLQGSQEQATLNAINRQERMRDAVAEGLTRQLMERLDEDPEKVAPVLIHWLQRETQETENLTQVFLRAERKLVEDAPQDGAQSSAAKTLDPDWLSRFARFAADVSVTEMQEIWARLLASEVESPGEVTLSTLRVLSEMDGSVAAAFQQCAQMSLDGTYLLRRSGMIWNHDLNEAHVEQFGLLEEHGLVSLSLTRTMPTYAAQVGTVSGRSIVHGDLALFAAGGKDAELNFALVPLTRPGRAIRTFLPSLSPLELVRELAKWVSQNTPKLAIYRCSMDASRRPNLEKDPLEVIRWG